LLPGARRGDPRPFADAARRARPVTWTAVALVVLSGFYNVTQLGPLERVLQSGAGLMLAAKFTLVIVAVALAAQRDFAHLPILDAAIRGGGDATRALTAGGVDLSESKKSSMSRLKSASGRKRAGSMAKKQWPVSCNLRCARSVRWKRSPYTAPGRMPERMSTITARP